MENKIRSLDSVRGLAALMVVVCHFVFAFWLPLKRHPVSPLHVFHDGEFAVRLFFVLSGFVLSLTYLRTRQPDVLRWAAVRRYFRLFWPIAASVAVSYGFLSLGLYQNGRAAALLGPVHGDWLTHLVQFPPSAPAALREIVWDSFFDHHPECSYNAVLWTMGIEFMGSLFIFALLALAGGLKYRGVIYVLVAAVLVRAGHFFMLDFLLGLILCEWVALGNPPRTPAGFWPAVAAAGLVLGGLSRPWLTELGAGRLAVGAGYWKSVGAGMVIAGVIASPALNRALEKRPFIWLGRLSFPLYVFHLPILLSLGCWLYAVLTVGFGLSHDGSAAAACAACLAVTLPVAHVAALTLEPFSIRCGRWVAGRLLGNERAAAGQVPVVVYLRQPVREASASSPVEIFRYA